MKRRNEDVANNDKNQQAKKLHKRNLFFILFLYYLFMFCKLM